MKVKAQKIVRAGKDHNPEDMKHVVKQKIVVDLGAQNPLPPPIPPRFEQKVPELAKNWDPWGDILQFEDILPQWQKKIYEAYFTGYLQCDNVKEERSLSIYFEWNVKDGKSELTMKTFPDENKTNNSTKPAKKKSSGKKNKKTSVKKMMIRGYYPFKTRKSTFSLSGIHSSKQVDPPKPPNPPPPPLGKVRK